MPSKSSKKPKITMYAGGKDLPMPPVTEHVLDPILEDRGGCATLPTHPGMAFLDRRAKQNVSGTVPSASGASSSGDGTKKECKGGDSDAGDAALDRRDSATYAAAPLQCRVCEGIFKKDQVMICLDFEKLVAGWQGDYNLHCKKCYEAWYNKTKDEDNMEIEMSDKEWKKAAKKSWDAKRKAAGDILQSVRSASYETLSKGVIERPDGMNSKEYRATLLQHVTTLGHSVKKSLALLPREKKKAAIREFDKWIASIARMESDEGYLIDLDETQISDLAAQFLDEVIPGFIDIFICRRRGCGFAGRNVDWVMNQPGHKYRCIWCGQEYKPWKQQPGYVKANKLFVLDARVHDRTDGAEFEVWPYIWVDVSTTNMLNYMKSLMSDINNDLSKMTKRQAVEAAMKYSLDKPIPACFKLQKMTSEAIEEITTFNNNTNGQKFNVEEIKDNDFYGTKTEEIGPLMRSLDEPLEQKDCMMFLASGFYLVKQAELSDSKL